MTLTPEEKRKLSESDICDLYITPAIKNAGWDPFPNYMGGPVLWAIHMFALPFY